MTNNRKTTRNNKTQPQQPAFKQSTEHQQDNNDDNIHDEIITDNIADDNNNNSIGDIKKLDTIKMPPPKSTTPLKEQQRSPQLVASQKRTRNGTKLASSPSSQQLDIDQINLEIDESGSNNNNDNDDDDTDGNRDRHAAEEEDDKYEDATLLAATTSSPSSSSSAELANFDENKIDFTNIADMDIENADDDGMDVVGKITMSMEERIEDAVKKQVAKIIANTQQQKKLDDHRAAISQERDRRSMEYLWKNDEQQLYVRQANEYGGDGGTFHDNLKKRKQQKKNMASIKKSSSSSTGSSSQTGATAAAGISSFQLPGLAAMTSSSSSSNASYSAAAAAIAATTATASTSRHNNNYQQQQSPMGPPSLFSKQWQQNFDLSSAQPVAFKRQMTQLSAPSTAPIPSQIARMLNSQAVINAQRRFQQQQQIVDDNDDAVGDNTNFRATAAAAEDNDDDDDRRRSRKQIAVTMRATQREMRTKYINFLITYGVRNRIMAARRLISIKESTDVNGKRIDSQELYQIMDRFQESEWRNEAARWPNRWESLQEKTCFFEFMNLEDKTEFMQHKNNLGNGGITKLIHNYKSSFDNYTKKPVKLIMLNVKAKFENQIINDTLKMIMKSEPQGFFSSKENNNRGNMRIIKFTTNKKGFKALEAVNFELPYMEQGKTNKIYIKILIDARPTACKRCYAIKPRARHECPGIRCYKCNSTEHERNERCISSILASGGKYCINCNANENRTTEHRTNEFRLCPTFLRSAFENLFSMDIPANIVTETTDWESKIDQTKVERLIALTYI